MIKEVSGKEYKAYITGSKEERERVLKIIQQYKKKSLLKLERYTSYKSLCELEEEIKQC